MRTSKCCFNGNEDNPKFHESDCAHKTATYLFEMPQQSKSNQGRHGLSLLTILILLTASMITVVIIGLIASTINGDDEDAGEPLFLTPLIQLGQIEKAVEAAKVIGFPPYVSYSGYITVNSTYNSNLFFWFFPAQGKPLTDNTIPVILWNDGGPGDSAFYSIFGGSGPGPFLVNAEGKEYSLNPNAWNKKYHIIYMDNPVSVGYSFTDNETNGLVNSAPDAAHQIYEFLLQFFTLFPDLQPNPFYAAGVSYGTTYAVQVANRIHEQQHQKNNFRPKVSMNLKGLILDSPWLDPYSQIQDYGNYLFNAGLISTKMRDYFNGEINKTLRFLEEDNYSEASSTWHVLLNPNTTTATGYTAFNNIYADDQQDPPDMTDFGNKNSTRKSLHVGSKEFTWFNFELQNNMIVNVLRSSKKEMESLLQAGYKFFVTVGNMDGLTGHLGVQRVIKSLSWDGKMSDDLWDWKIWKENGRIAGYNTTISNLTLLIVRNAGHATLLNQPERVFSAVNKFINFERENN